MRRLPPEAQDRYREALTRTVEWGSDVGGLVLKTRPEGEGIPDAQEPFYRAMNVDGLMRYRQARRSLDGAAPGPLGQVEAGE